MLESLNPDTKITSHRGGALRAPENTLSALNYTWECGADYAEIDIQETKDKQLILLHDDSLKRITGLDKKVWEMTYEEIEELDAGSSFGKGYQGEKIPALEDVLNFCLGRLDLNIEIKYNGKNKGIVQRVIQVIRENHFEEHCVVTSMNYRFLEEIKETAPEIRTGYIMTMSYGSISQVAAADFFSVRYDYITEGFVREAHALGKEVHAWTVNYRGNIKRMLDMGVDNIITDDPHLSEGCRTRKVVRRQVFWNCWSMVLEFKRRVNMPKKNKKTRRARTRYYDYNLVAIVVLLTCFGLVMLYSTSAYTAQVNYENDMQFFGRQAAISIVSILIALFISRLDYHILYYISGAIYVASMILMLLVKFSPLGREVNGARRWLTIIPGTSAQLQPSELAKIAAITFIPCLIIKMGKQVKTLRGSLFLLCTGGILAMGAFQLTENLSTGIIIGAITVLMIFIAHPKTRPFIIGAVVLAVLVVVGRLVLQWVLGDTVVSTENLSSFRLERILVWLNPEQYSSEGGYQIMQALYAIGSGGFFGKGLGNSVQKLGPVPEAQNDMIFSIVCEELGVFGGLVVLILFGYLLYRLFFIAENAPDFYGSLVVGGIMIHIACR